MEAQPETGFLPAQGTAGQYAALQLVPLPDAPSMPGGSSDTLLSHNSASMLDVLLELPGDMRHHLLQTLHRPNFSLLMMTPHLPRCSYCSHTETDKELVNKWMQRLSGDTHKTKPG